MPQPEELNKLTEQANTHTNTGATVPTASPTPPSAGLLLFPAHALKRGGAVMVTGGRGWGGREKCRLAETAGQVGGIAG